MLKRSFFDFFPPPGFLQMSGPGFSISDTAIRFIDIEKKNKELRIGDFGEMLLPEGVIVDGDIKKPDELSKMLKAFCRRHRIKYIRSTIPEEKAYLFTAKIPKIEEDEISSSIEFIIEENVPLLLSESVFDYEIIKTDQDDLDNQIGVSVSVLPNDAVQAYQNAFNMAELMPVHYMIESQAIAKSVVLRGDLSPILIVHLCKAKFGLYIVYGNTVNFTSTTSITEIKTDPTSPEEKLKDIDSAYPSIKEVVKETERVLVYWKNYVDRMSIKEKKIKKIIVCGVFGNIVGIDKYLEEKLKIDTEIANVWKNIFSIESYVPEIPKEVSLNYATPIGLALTNYYKEFNV